MSSSILDIIKYTKMFQDYLGLRIYLIFFLGLFAALSEGFGILLLLPLLESLDGTMAYEDLSGINKFAIDFINLIGIEDSTSGIILLITIAFIIKGLVTFIALGFSAYLIGKLLRELKFRLFDNYSHMTYGYYSSKNTGHFTNLINEQPIKALEAFRQLTTFGGQLVTTVVLMSIAFFMTWKFGLMAFGVGVVLLLIFMRLNNYVRNLSRITASENGILTRWLIQTLQAFKYLTTTAQTSLLRKNIIKSIDTLTGNQVKSCIAAAFTQSIREPIAVVFIMMVVFIQIYIFQSEVTPILVSIVLFYRALNATLAVQSGFQGTFQHIGSMELVHQEFIRQKNNQAKDGSKILNTLEKSIVLENISFRYENKEKNVLEDISMHINAKESIAIVGESGSGKSTLVDLISLMHTPTNGKIFIDGTNGNDISKHSWRSQLGYVSQETIIFDDTIANNICMWRGDYSNDKNLFTKIREVAKQANILDFIDSLDDGFNSMVGDRGVLLSGGQRQRLFVARELFRKPNLLILDEATSALDSESEKEIQKSIDNLKGKITVIAIAHRLSTIKNVDLIYVLKDGRIIESGSYTDLTKDDKSNFSKMIEFQSLTDS